MGNIIKERPILFTGPMVRALMDGRKTQTRRAIKVQPPSERFRISTLLSTTGDRRNEGRHFWGRYSAIGNALQERTDGYFPCPYGEVGDRLWVRETFAYNWGHVLPTPFIAYRADSTDDESRARRWKSGIFMSRAASRVLLEITALRVERLHDISPEDAIAEGIKICPNMNGRPGSTGYVWPDSPYDKCKLCHSDPYTAYMKGWRLINGEESELSNPWVWVVEFKVIAPPSPTLEKTAPKTL